MSINLRRTPVGFILVTLFAISGSQSRAAVAYVANCCNHPSTVSVFETAEGHQAGQWNVGAGAFAVVFSPDGRTAYVSDEIAQSISVVQVATGHTLASIPVGYQISWMTITADGHTLFAESYDYAYESHIVQIDTVTDTVRQAVGFAAYLGPMVVTPDGKTLYVNSSFSAQPGLLVVDAQTLRTRMTIAMGASNGIAITPDGKFVYVPTLGLGQPYSPNVEVVDTATNTVTATIALGTNLNPGLAQISPDGSMLWVSEFPLYSNVVPVVTVIATNTNQISREFNLLGKATPGAIVFAPNGKRAWVVAGNAAVDVIDTASMEAVSETTTLGSVGGPAVSPNGRLLLLPNSGNSQAAVIAQASQGRLANIPLGAMDWSTNQLFQEYGGAAASPDSTRVYMTNYASSNVSVIDTASKKVVKSVVTGGSPVGVVISPDSSRAYVANSTSNSVTVIDTKTFGTTQIAMPQFTYPSSITISPDGSHVYVTGDNVIPDFGTAKCYVFVIDTSSNQVVASIRIPYPIAVAASPDGTKIYVVGGLSYLYTISTATNTIINSLLLENGGPIQPVTGGIAVTPDGTRVFADDGQDNKVFEVDVTKNKIAATIRAGSVPGILAITPDGTQVWAGDYYSTSLSIIDIARAEVTATLLLGGQSYGIAFGAQ